MTSLIYDPIYSQLNLPAGHRFPIEKYRKLYEKLLSEGVPAAGFLRPTALRPEQVQGPLSPAYVADFVAGGLDDKAVRKMGFPWSPILVARTLTAVAGTILAGMESLQQGSAINLSGGYHHAFYDHGSGFCIFNDLWLSALNLIQQPTINRVLIFDCDVHQGDGTASLAQGHEQIFTVSIHGEKNFPFVKQRSDWDVSLDKGVGDDEYLTCVDSTLREAIDRFRPDAVIYDAGADIFSGDELGHFEVTLGGVLRRDQLVFEACEQAGLPVSAVIGGGYQRDIDALVEVHLQLFRAAGVVA
ncbi:histone deacetylase [Pseudomaricurvus sp. HS19]|uniref:histone deacetylase family protein n=1 Tax=Pseudomaricurvus sp. HS19 TaxID=2692626 RepID=UPI00137019E0|nr:histone deacetylase [Pseudomaricurvus sp. HS19]MYM61932.1 histone deacetylase [Pseudomaricurvus sp. HS19]